VPVATEPSAPLQRPVGKERVTSPKRARAGLQTASRRSLRRGADGRRRGQAGGAGPTRRTPDLPDQALVLRLPAVTARRSCTRDIRLDPDAVRSVAVAVGAIRKDRSGAPVKPAGFCFRRIASGDPRRPCLRPRRDPKRDGRGRRAKAASVLKNVVITKVRTAWYACLRRSDLSAGTRKIEGGGVVAALAEQLGGGDHPGAGVGASGHGPDCTLDLCMTSNLLSS